MNERFTIPPGGMTDSNGNHHYDGTVVDTVYRSYSATDDGARNTSAKYSPRSGRLYGAGKCYYDQTSGQWFVDGSLNADNRDTIGYYYNTQSNKTKSTISGVTVTGRNESRMELTVKRTELVKKLKARIASIEAKKKTAVEDHIAAYAEKVREKPENYIDFHQFDTTTEKTNLRDLELATDETVTLSQEQLRNLLGTETE